MENPINVTLLMVVLSGLVFALLVALSPSLKLKLSGWLWASAMADKQRKEHYEAARKDFAQRFEGQEEAC